MTLTLGHFLTLGAMLFAIAVVGIFLNRKNLIVLLMAIELMLLLLRNNSTKIARPIAASAAATVRMKNTNTCPCMSPR